MFCMLLRKHLSGGRLVSIQQPPMERLVRLTFQCTGELGDQVERVLVAELMGRTTNIYLLDEAGRILDCLRRVGLDDSAKRQALPGLYYQDPEPVEKRCPQGLTQAEALAPLEAPGADRLADRLLDTFGGLSPLVCREAALACLGTPTGGWRGGPGRRRPGPGNLLPESICPWGRPYLLTGPGGPKAYAFVPIFQYGPDYAWEELPSFASLLDRFYTLRDRRDAMRQKAQSVRRTVQNLRDRTARKMAIQEKRAGHRPGPGAPAPDGRPGHRQPPRHPQGPDHPHGGKLLRSGDEAHPNSPVPPLLSPQQNAAKYYKDYAKAKSGGEGADPPAGAGGQELEYLLSVLEELDRAETEGELEEIRQELASGGYLRLEGGRRKMKQAASKPMRFVSTDGYPIYVGRNNRQNDELTGKLAQKNDLWLHVQKLHGSHVIIPGRASSP